MPRQPLGIADRRTIVAILLGIAEQALERVAMRDAQALPIGGDPLVIA